MEAIIETHDEKQIRQFGEQAVDCLKRNEVLVIIPTGYLDTDGGMVILRQCKPSGGEA